MLWRTRRCHELYPWLCPSGKWFGAWVERLGRQDSVYSPLNWLCGLPYKPKKAKDCSGWGFMPIHPTCLHLTLSWIFKSSVTASQLRRFQSLLGEEPSCPSRAAAFPVSGKQVCLEPLFPSCLDMDPGRQSLHFLYCETLCYRWLVSCIFKVHHTKEIKRGRTNRNIKFC